MNIGNWIARTERKYIPKFRLNKWYKITKAILLTPLVLPLYYLQVGWVSLTAKRIPKSKAIEKLQHIVNGWTNLIIEDPVAEEIALRRASICASCPFAEEVGGLSMIAVDNRTKQIRGMKCGKCGCPLSAKVRSLNDHCPIGQW